MIKKKHPKNTKQRTLYNNYRNKITMTIRV